MNVTYKRDPRDEKYSVPFISTSLNPCKIVKGMLPTVMQRSLLATFAESSNTEMYCPFPKNKRVIVSNLTITDSFLPPMKIEKNFKIHTMVYIKIKEKKGWIFINENTWYGSYKN